MTLEFPDSRSRQSELKFRVSGGVKGDALGPITIETSGPDALQAPFLQRLTKAFDENGWRYRVVPMADGAMDDR